MTYPSTMRLLALPMNLRAHCACTILDALGFRFCVDYGYANAEAMVAGRGLAEDVDLLVTQGSKIQWVAGDIPMAQLETHRSAEASVRETQESGGA